MTRKKATRSAPAKAGAPDMLGPHVAKKPRKKPESREINWKDRSRGEPLLLDFVQAFEDWEADRRWRDANDDAAADEAEEEHFVEKTELIVAGLKRYLEHEVNNLSEAFDLFRPTGYRRPAARLRFEHMRMLQMDGLKFVQAGAKVDEVFFEVLGAMHGIGKTLASEWWSERRYKIQPRNLIRCELPQELERYRPELNWHDKNRD